MKKGSIGTKPYFRLSIADHLQKNGFSVSRKAIFKCNKKLQHLRHAGHRVAFALALVFI
jgi:hypothetical protein